MRDLLERLKAWKAQHDQDRARQPPPFLLMAWDAVFGDEDDQVTEAIRQIEEALPSVQGRKPAATCDAEAPKDAKGGS
jgi:hypothetical protein